MKKAEFVRYIADDGKMFCREDECLEYEKNHNASAEFMLNEIPHKIVIDDELTHLSLGGKTKEKTIGAWSVHSLSYRIRTENSFVVKVI